MLLATITSARHSRWPGDRTIAGLKSAGLSAPCVVRLKLFTLDNRLLIRKIGRLGGEDRAAVEAGCRAGLIEPSD
jgi:mRNA interferase MazF